MSPVCRYRQHLFNCGHVLFHRSYGTAGGWNEPLLVAVLGLKGWRTIICWRCYIAWYVSCLGCYCTHVTWQWDSEGLLNWCRTEHFHVPFLQWHLVISTWTWGESYTYRAGRVENIHRVSEGWSCLAETEDCLVLNSLHRLWKGGMLRFLAFWWLGESQTLYSKSMKWRYIYIYIYMCVCLWSECYPVKL